MLTTSHNSISIGAGEKSPPRTRHQSYQYSTGLTSHANESIRFRFFCVNSAAKVGNSARVSADLTVHYPMVIGRRSRQRYALINRHRLRKKSDRRYVGRGRPESICHHHLVRFIVQFIVRFIVRFIGVHVEWPQWTNETPFSAPLLHAVAVLTGGGGHPVLLQDSLVIEN